MCYTYSLRILLLTHSEGLNLKPFTDNGDLHIYKSEEFSRWKTNKQTNKQTNKIKVFNSNPVNEVAI